MTETGCVYLLDDDPAARKGLARLLRAAGHRVCAFASADEFLENIDPEASGCMVLDARMPGLAAEELRAELDARDLCMPIIVVSADDGPETRRKAEQIRAVGFFRKPVDGAALLDAVAWALRSHGVGGNHVR